MKRTSACVLLLLLLLSACAAPNQEVQRAEVMFWHGLVQAEAQSLESFLADCKCQNGDFVTRPCREAAALIQLVHARASWHYQASLSNLDLVEPPIYPPPPILPGSLLCIKSSSPPQSVK